MRFFLTLVFITIWSISFYLYFSSGLGYKYNDSGGDQEYRSITFSYDNRIAVKPAIIDYQIINGIAIGYRLPSYSVTCESDKYPATMLTLSPMYFILTLDSGDLVEFEDEHSLKIQLMDRDLSLPDEFSEQNVNLIIEHYKNKYSNSDFYRSCRPIEIRNKKGADPNVGANGVGPG